MGLGRWFKRGSSAKPHSDKLLDENAGRATATEAEPRESAKVHGDKLGEALPPEHDGANK